MDHCPNCGRRIYGFWKYGPHYACCLACFRAQVADGRIPSLQPYTAVPELGILPPRNPEPKAQ